MLILKAKNFKKRISFKTFSCLLNCINNRYIFFELMSRRNIHQTSVPRAVKLCKISMTKCCEKSSVEKKGKRKSSLSRKPERAV